MQITARDLIGADPEEVFQTFPNVVTVVFDDGEVTVMDIADLALSMIFWRFIQAYPQLPLIRKYTIRSTLNGAVFGSNSAKSLMETITKDIYELYNFYTPEQIEPVKRLICIVNNEVGNIGSAISEAYPLDVDLEDFMEMVDHPHAIELRQKCKPDSDSISMYYAELEKFAKNHPDFAINKLSFAIRSGLVNSMQTYQCVGVRGLITEVNSHVIPTAVMTNYTLGMYDIADLAIESRSGAKNLYLTDAALEDSEYFARRLQLLCMVVEKIVYQDCGTTNYLNWEVKGPTYNEFGLMTYEGDLKFMIGKYYLDEATGKLRVIRGKSDSHLNGKTIKLRTVTRCKHPDNRVVCHVCFGKLASNFPGHGNIGYSSAGTMTQQATQGIMSNKHLDKSSSGGQIRLDNVASHFFELTADRTSVAFKQKLSKKKFKIVLPADSAGGLISVSTIANINDLHPPRISRVKDINLVMIEQGEEVYLPVTINQTSLPANLTMEALLHVKRNGFTLDDRNNFIIGFDDWDFSQPVFEIPEMEYNQAEHNAQISSLIESSMVQVTQRHTAHSHDRTLIELFSLVNSKLNVPLSCLEIIMYAVSIHAPDNFDLPRNTDSMMLGIGDKLIRDRSVSAMLAYEDILPGLWGTNSWDPRNRPNSPMDVFVCPDEVVKDPTREQL